MSSILEEALQTNIADQIAPDIVSHLLSQDPWISINGVHNVRDLGHGSGSQIVRERFIYRSALLESITERGKLDIQNLGIKKIFDLRSAKEMREFPDPTIEGVEVVHAACVATTTSADAGRDTSLPGIYMEMLTSHQAAWKVILEHIRDFPEQPFLFHCTGGKDRTGVAAAMILSLAGCAVKDISHEYALSRIGVEPGRDLLQRLAGGREVDMRSERFQRIAKISAETMEEFLGDAEKLYGGFGQYAETVLGLSGEDVGGVRRNLVRSGIV